jgi:hypothetical protein
MRSGDRPRTPERSAFRVCPANLSGKTKEAHMLIRGLAAALIILALGGLALAESHRGLIVDLTDSKLTILVRVEGKRKAEKTTLEVAEKVAIVQPRGKEQKEVSFSELRKRVARAQKNFGGRGVRATVETKGDKVVAVRIDASRVPEKVMAILDKAEEIELYSLEPEPEKGAGKAPKASLFHGWLVLGKTALKDAKTRKAALDALDESVGMGAMAKCFDPRHAIRAAHGGTTVDLLICFACGQVYVYFNGNRDKTLVIARGTQPALDDILKAAGVPLAKAKAK